MKTKSLTAMLMAMALSFNFAACSDDDDNGGGGSASGDATKRLVKMYVKSIYVNHSFEIEYDEKGRVSKNVLTWEESTPWRDTYTYLYNGNEVTISATIWEGNDEEGEHRAEYTYTLNDKGYVVNGFSDDQNEYIFSYSDDYLVSVTKSYDNGVPRIVEQNQIIADGLILPHDWDAVEYTEIPNKINFFFHYSNEIDIFDTFEYMELYLANLAGKAPKYLPESVTDGEGSWYFSYKLDDEGYPTAITLSDEDRVFTTITCTYEPIP